MNRFALILTLILTALLLISCTAGPNIAAFGAEGPAGFWKGLWHGFIALFTFIISLFNDNVSMYEVVNKGGLYDLGFIIGVMAFWGGGGSGTACRSKKQ